MGSENLGVTFTSVTQVTINTGSCRSDDDTFDIIVTSNIVQSITTVGANGRYTAAAEAADTWYAVYVIADSTGLNPPAGILVPESTYLTPVLPSGYDVKRRRGWAYNNGSSNFRSFNLNISAHAYHEILYAEVEESELEVLTGGTSTAYSTVSLAAQCPPTTRNANLVVSHDGDVDGECVRLRFTGSTVVAGPTRVFAGGAGGRQRVSSYMRLRISSTQSIQYQNSVIGNTTYIWVLGYVDTLQ